MQVAINKQLNNEPNGFVKKILTTAFILTLVMWSFSTIEYKGIQEKGLGIAGSIVTGIFNPNTDLLFNFTSTGIPYLLLETIAIAVLGTIIGAIVSIPLAFACSSNIVPKWISTIGTFVVAGIRTFPSFVYGLMFIRVAGPGPFTGVLTISVISIGMITKLYIESIEDLDKKILESLDAAGCTVVQKVRYGILPQLSTNFVSTAIYRFEINLKEATVLGLVGAGGIGAPLISGMNSYKWSDVGAILVGLIILVLIVEYVSTKVRTKLTRG